MHGALPFTVLYVPKVQDVHALALDPVNPGLQTHAAIAELELGELELLGQDTHDAEPTREYDPARQVVHTVELLAPTLTEYLPASQGAHTPNPMDGLYVPAAQAVQLFP